MILTCPDCSTQYSVKDGAIGPNGRTVRCSNCSATWFVAADADSLALADNIRDEIEKIDTPSPEDTAPAKTPTKPVMGAHVQVRDKADRQRRNKRLFGVSMIWGVTLSILLAAVILAYVNRQAAVDRYPATATIYKAFGIDVKLGGLDFESPSTSRTIIDGQQVLVINGTIVNRSATSRDVPPVQLSLVNGGGDVITEWLVEVDEQKIGPKQRISYMAQYPNPPLDAVDLKYKFHRPGTLQ